MIRHLDSKIVHLHVGQAGVQLGHATWQLLSLEHSLLPDGDPLHPEESQHETAFFHQGRDHRSVARSIMVDTEPIVVDEMRVGPYRQLYNPQYMLTGKEDAANNFARGQMIAGNALRRPFEQALRRLHEECDLVQGHVLQASIGGGTGSGFGSSIVLRHLADQYPKACNMQVSIMPGSQLSTAVVEPYNSVLSARSSIDNTDFCFLADNQALYNICSNTLGLDFVNYITINRVLAQVLVNAVCVPMLGHDAGGCDLNQMGTNLVPYPCIHFPVASYAPFVRVGQEHQVMINPRTIVTQLFQEENRTVLCELERGKYMSCCINFRGQDVPLTEVNRAIQGIKGVCSRAKSAPVSIQFVDWVPSGFKLGFSQRPPLIVPFFFQPETPMSAVMLCNNTATGMVWMTSKRRFCTLYRKRAFVHWFVSEGMEEAEFDESLAQLQDLCADYLSLDPSGLSEADNQTSCTAKKLPEPSSGRDSVGSSEVKRKQVTLSEQVSPDEEFDFLFNDSVQSTPNPKPSQPEKETTPEDTAETKAELIESPVKIEDGVNYISGELEDEDQESRAESEAESVPQEGVESSTTSPAIWTNFTPAESAKQSGTAEDLTRDPLQDSNQEPTQDPNEPTTKKKRWGRSKSPKEPKPTEKPAKKSKEEKKKEKAEKRSESPWSKKESAVSGESAESSKRSWSPFRKSKSKTTSLDSKSSQIDTINSEENKDLKISSETDKENKKSKKWGKSKTEPSESPKKRKWSNQNQYESNDELEDLGINSIDFGALILNINGLANPPESWPKYDYEEWE